jgi:hypothetical protein
MQENSTSVFSIHGYLEAGKPRWRGTPDSDQPPVRLPFCLPQNERGSWVPTSIRRLSPQRTFLKKDGPSGNEGLNLFIEGGRINGEMYWKNVQGPIVRGTSCNRVAATSLQFKAD